MSINDRYLDGTHIGRNPGWGEQNAAWKAEQVARILDDNGVRPGSICDVGCGTGGVIDNLGRHFPDARLVGYELSTNALGLADEGRQGRVELRNADARDDDETFDVMTMMDVFEHVEDYMGFLRALRHKGRHAVFHIPLDLSVLTVARSTPILGGRASVGHIHYFTRETALATLVDSGYEIVDERFTTPSISRARRKAREKVAKLPRAVGYRLSPQLTARVLGGFPLLVLARASR